MIKRFVLDTNIILQSPKSMTEGFEDNTVIIVGTVLQELDKKKTVGGEVGYNARECCRILDELRVQGDLIKGVDLPSGGKVMFEPDGVKSAYLPEGYSLDVPDNRIISSCIHLKNRGDEPLILVTNDVSMRINATACGVEVQGYRNSIVEKSGYKGYRDVDVSKEFIDNLYQNKIIEVDESLFESPLVMNEFVTLHCGNQAALSVHREGSLELIKEMTLFGGVKPKNALQTYAMWALTQPADKIPLVILLGPAGCAKTFLSLAAGLSETYTTQYHRQGGDYYKMLISRPTADSFDQVGFLPGTLEEKLHNLYQNFYDNIEILLAGNGKVKEDHQQIQMQMEDMFSDGIIEVCGLNFIRGRSLMNTYMICDEAQNATKGCIRDVITRAGAGTKMVIAGDPEQIDMPTLDKRNNGLVYAAEHMKGSPLAVVLQFDAKSSVRSPLAKEAIQRMEI